jgi:magnesium transporter
MNNIFATAFPADGNLLVHTLANGHVADLVEYLNTLPDDEAATALAALPPGQAVEVFDRPELNRASELLVSLPGAASTHILREMSADRAADVLRVLDRGAQALLLAPLEPEPAGTLRRLLAYPEHSAGSLMTTEFVSLPTTVTVGRRWRISARWSGRARPSTPCICWTPPRGRWCAPSPSAA